VGFAERGATVGICARRVDRLAEVLERCRVHAPESRSWTVEPMTYTVLVGPSSRATDLLSTSLTVTN
jgi:hypothetical protein